ncbi:hypothetical protein GCM10010341_53730 [Streptomyces noursei]|nr:hypothetical protein GCM10010341_53730 [Streptomyces noursei]
MLLVAVLEDPSGAFRMVQASRTSLTAGPRAGGKSGVCPKVRERGRAGHLRDPPFGVRAVWVIRERHQMPGTSLRVRAA